jgi:simple sugar transport system permease protein
VTRRSAAAAVRSALDPVIQPAITVALSLAVGFVVVALVSNDPFGAYGSFLFGSFGSAQRFANLLGTATPLIIVGMSVVVSFRAGVFNVGGDGQLYLGALVGAIVGFTLVDVPGVLLIAVVLVAAALAGAVWSGLAGALKAYLGVDEVVTTIMLNFIAILFTDWMVANPIRDPTIGAPSSRAVATQAQLGPLVSGSTLTVGILVALAIVVVTWALLFRTTWGADVRAVGTSPDFAAAVGVRVRRKVVGAMLVAGAFAGIAGAVQVLAVTHRFYQNFSASSGLIGLTVALLGRLNPWGTLATALLYATLLNGAAIMELDTQVPRPLVDVLAGMIVLLMTAEGRRLLRRVLRPRAVAA